MIAFFLSPLGRYLLAALAIVGLLWALYSKVTSDAIQADRAAQERAVRHSSDAASDARDRVRDCVSAGGRWVQSDGTCDRLHGVPSPDAGRPGR